ncbi:MAG TPA: sensor histidine kinase [Gemmatimonadales bacterium]|nr:sensor histidine kinase [Gemmatimonadales bacterium]
MGSIDGALLAFFISGALTVALALGAMVLFLVLSQRKTVALHRKYAQDLLKAQEDERAWVAREVHDDAVQRLAVIANELSDVLPQTVSPEGNRVQGIVGEVQDLGISLRKLAHRLHPSAIDKGGIVPALEQLASDMHAGLGLEVRVEVQHQPAALSRDSELALYRIAQESLRNVATHAGVLEATVRLARESGQVVLEISDQGGGLGPPNGAGGIGLMSMKERARLAGGTLTLTSRPGMGTIVRVVLPEVSHV